MYPVGLEEAHADLHTAPLAVRHFVEAPVQVNVQQVDEFLAAGRVHPLHPKNHLPSRNVTLQAAVFSLPCI